MTTLIKGRRKFQEEGNFGTSKDQYWLLPFRFHRLTDKTEILVNEVGDYVTVPSGTTKLIIKKKLSKTNSPELYKDLAANFIISQKPVPDLLDTLATRYRTKKSFLDHFTSLHIFVITLRCEHTCQYCQVSRVTQDKERYDMSFEHIDKGIDMMLKSPNNHVTMEFQGGESLLAFEKIVYAVTRTKKLLKQIDKHVTFVICTNLALITAEMLDFCKENDILISTSLDGPSNIHNINRPRSGKNSYELLLNGIALSRKILGADRVSALMTTTSLSLNHPKEIVDEYFQQGFRNIFLRPISPYGFATKNPAKNIYDTDKFLEFYKTAFQHILQYNLGGKYFREDYATVILKKILTPFPVGYVDLQSPAGLINSVIVFNYEGSVYATDEARMLAEMKDYTFKLGHLDENTYHEIFYGDKAQEIAKVWANETLSGCSDCAFQAYCGADPVHNYATQGDIYGHRPTSSFCKRNMEIIRYLIELMESDKIIKQIFQSWVSPLHQPAYASQN